MGFEPAPGRAPSDGGRYERLCRLSTGPLGELALGRARGQGDASRFVTLRALPHNAEHLQNSVRRAANIAHPRLTKVLGLAWIDEVPYLASEYVEGLSAGELARELRSSETSVIQEVALRITLDALRAVSAARAALVESGVREPLRCLYPDTAWIATFGETLLSDVGLASELFSLNPNRDAVESWSGPRGRSRDVAKEDVFAAGALLCELLSGRPFPSVGADPAGSKPARDLLPGHGRPIAKQLLDLVERATATDPRQRFETPEQMTEAILALPEHWLGNEAQVEAAIEVLAHRATDLRASEPSLELTSGAHEAEELWEIPTRSLKLRLPSEEDDRLTLRPEEPTK